MGKDTHQPNLGDRVREIVTKKKGTITGFCEYLWGCQQFLVYIDDETDKDGNPRTEWYDVGRLEVIDRAAVRAINYGPAFAGPDKVAPTR